MSSEASLPKRRRAPPWLVHAADAEVDGVEQRRARLALREDMQRITSFFAVKAGSLNRLFDSVMTAHERNRFGQIRVSDHPLLQGAPPKGPFFHAAPAIGEDDRQRYLPFPEIVADTLAKAFGFAGVIEGVVDKLEGQADIRSIQPKGGLLGLRYGL